MLKLRKLLFWGVPKIGSGEDHITNVKSDDVVRPLLWRLMTDVLPPEPAKWAETEKLNRENYEAFKQDFIIEALTDSPNSIWTKYYKANGHSREYFEADFERVKEMYKQLRIDEIRAARKNKKKQEEKEEDK